MTKSQVGIILHTKQHWLKVQSIKIMRCRPKFKGLATGSVEKQRQSTQVHTVEYGKAAGSAALP